MATAELRDKIFTNLRPLVVWVDGNRLDSYSYDGEFLSLRSVETVDFDKGKHLYYEYEISPEMWEAAEVEGNVIMLNWSTGQPLDISITIELPVDLERDFEESEGNDILH